MTQKELKTLLRYDKETGFFWWAKSVNRKIIVHSKAGCVNRHGYNQIKLNGKNYLAHRLAWLYEYGEFPPEEIDHINHDRFDNKIINLRTVLHKENSRNKSARSNRKSDGITGVHFNKRDKLWYAVIGVNGKQKHLGCFKEMEEAIKCRKIAQEKYGFHPNHS